MKARTIRLLSLSFAAACCLVVGGCSIVPEAKSDPTRFYVLSTSAAGRLAAPPPNSPTVQLRPVELANYLRARPLIVRRGNNEIEFREFARWGEPLESGISRVLREEMLARGAAGAVTIPGPRRDNANYDYTLNVRLLACEGATGGTIVFRAIWELASARPESSSIAAAGDYQPTDLRWDGKTEASLAAELSQAVAGLAAEISAALKK